MKHKIQDFDFFKPVLSTDIIKVEGPVPNTKPVSQYLNNNQSKKKNRRRNKKGKPNQTKLPQIRETQEEIDAWIAERKKRFPTRSRVNTKLQEEIDREERGAISLNGDSKNKEKQKRISPIEASTKSPVKIHSFIDELTEDEERRERSIILQCFRYFVRHNFLQDPLIISQTDQQNEEEDECSTSYDSYSEHQEDEN
ncbi:hypothetical protein GPJ56_005150 [Histomonas meleagridis]|uniref:uncharacterized protein n=1 Tax=Histomonas meleagridis TaxID=135588 RepID=UPI00355A20BB|nr:hypothetical protein GPJ56_005150 [Histomonas meleagridis]KAH0802666.1 hypothetical protein GO595_004715 [Histomonas meleagridis]